jgi:Domain of unknown function (DUF3786)
MADNITNLIDKSYFDELSGRNPDEICRLASCRYENVTKSYTLSAWGDDYLICPEEYRIDCIKQNNSKPHEYFYLFLIYYLLNTKKNNSKPEWISEKDIPGGATFFRGPHEIPTILISEKYKNDLEWFEERCAVLGGQKLDMADAAYSFKIVQHIEIAVLYWIGDEDFSPEAKILYDRTIIDHLSLDIIFSLAVAVCERIGNTL